MTWLYFRLGEAKWQHCPTRWMLVMSSSDSSVLDTENGDLAFEERCAIIHFFLLRGMKPIQIHQQLSETCNDDVMDMKNVCSWVKQFEEGWTSCENKPKEPQPRTSQSEDMIAWVEQMVMEDRHDCETDSCQCQHICWICGHHLAWRPENAESFCEMGSMNADR